MGRRNIIKKRPHSYVERDSKGRFLDWSNRGRAQAADRRIKAKTKVKPGYGHLGDQKVRGRSRHRQDNNPSGFGMLINPPASMIKLKKRKFGTFGPQ